jgi:hypothetical protein
MIRRSILLASLFLLACAEEEAPLRLPPCSSMAAPVEVLRARSLSQLAPAGEEVVLSERREVSPTNLASILRRIDRAGTAVDVAPFRSWATSSNLVVVGDDIFWTENSLARPLARIETFTVPLAGGQPRPIGLLNIDWVLGGFASANPFAADAAGVYVTIQRYGSESSETDLYRISRTDGSARLLAHANGAVENAQLVDGSIWWTESFDDERVFRVPAEGPPTVEFVPVRDCYDLRVTAAHGFFCGSPGTLARYDLDGRNRQVLLDFSNGSGGGFLAKPFADEGNWLWLRFSNGDVAKLDVVDRKVESVVCRRAEGDVVLGPQDLFWLEQKDIALPTSSTTLWRTPR